MTASDDLVNGRQMSRALRGGGIGPHVYNSGLRDPVDGEGATDRGSRRRRHYRHQHGLSGAHVTGGQSGRRMMRDLDHALNLIEATIAAVKCR